MKPRARKKSLLIQQVGPELVILDQISNQAHRLNATAAFIWQNCDGQRTVANLSQLLQKQFEVKDSAEQLTRLALDQLQNLQLIEVEAGEKGRKISRRELGVRLAMAAAALPLIVSIAVPTPAQAASAGQAEPFCPPGTVPGSRACPNG